MSVSIPDAGGEIDPSYEPRAGLRLGRYELVKRIAAGGMAEVWVARQTGEFGFSRVCAVKVIRPEYADSASFRSMFLDEARLAAKIHHPHVVEVFDLGEQGPVLYLAMELVKGCTLSTLLRRQERAGGAPLTPGMIARIISDMAAGLHAAHELEGDDGAKLGLVHRDISPQNILISVDGVAKIADFGIAKALGRLADETDGGQIKGKYSYLSPEQAARRPLDRRTDVFSTGIVLWEALVGRRLFRGEDAIDTLTRVRSAPIPDPREIVPALPAELATVTMKALERDPALRYQTAVELSDALDAAAQTTGIAVSTRQLGAAIAARMAPSALEIPAAPSDEGTRANTARTASLAEASPGRRWGHRHTALLGLLVVTVGGVATVLVGARSSASSPPAAAASPGAPRVLAPPSPSGDVRPEPSVATTPAPTPSASAAAALPEVVDVRPRASASAPGRRPAAAPPPKPSPAKLPFGNPY